MPSAQHMFLPLLCFVALCNASLSPDAIEERADEAHMTFTYTRMGPSSVHRVTTGYTTSTLPCTETRTVYTVTTQPVEPGLTLTSTVTTSTTITATTPSTSVVPAPAQFTPVEVSVPGTSNVPPVQKLKRDLDDGARIDRSTLSRRGNPNQYSQRVDVNYWWPGSRCSTTVTTSTITRKTCRTPAPETVTTTSTSTSTVYTSTTTFYAACATNNIADSYSGFTLTGGGPDPPYTASSESFIAEEVYDPYSCCVAAILSSPPTTVWEHLFLFASFTTVTGSNASACITYTDDTCQAPRANPSGFNATWYANSLGNAYGINAAVGNAFCGQYNQGCYQSGNNLNEPFICSPP